ncbi:MAG TPA: hypothetical protein VG759_18180 [Candidatus Angelobacter sp.]|nr:hypothetical protein [Candidatus Angelobacter sp.]
MKHLRIAIFLASALVIGAASPACGQEPATNRAADESQIKDTSAATFKGINLVAEITRSLNSRKAKPGDEVKARITQDVMSKGLIVLPRESQLIGRVTEAKPHSKEDPEARLGIIFDKAQMKNGTQIEMTAIVQALASPFARPAFIDESDPMIVQANDRATKMTPHVGASTQRPTDTSVRSIEQKERLGKDANIAPESSAPWSPGSRLGSGSHGVFGLPNLALTAGKQPAITSIKGDVKLENGTQLVLKVIGIDR